MQHDGDDDDCDEGDDLAVITRTAPQEEISDFIGFVCQVGNSIETEILKSCNHVFKIWCTYLQHPVEIIKVVHAF